MDKTIIQAIQERSELDLLIESGIGVEIGGERVVIHEFPLRVLDMLAREMVSIEIEDHILKSNTEIESVKLVELHVTRLAKIAAIACLGLDAKSEEKVAEMQNRILDHMTPKKIEKLYEAIQLLMNIGSFTCSIRLIQEIKTGLPGLIEREA